MQKIQLGCFVSLMLLVVLGLTVTTANTAAVGNKFLAANPSIRPTVYASGSVTIPGTAQMTIGSPTSPGILTIIPPNELYLPLIFRPEPVKPLAVKNVILIIGDGMGFEQVKAGGLYTNGTAGSLSFEAFPCKAEMGTNSVDGVTDSAAAATAMATGVKVWNEVLGLALPGDGHELLTILEYARDQGLSTGLVTTVTITHATPAGFGAHAFNRHDSAEIASDLLTGSHANVLLGGGGEGMSVEAAQAAGYNVVTDRAGLLGLNPDQEDYLSGQFGIGALPYEIVGLGDLPHLSEMTRVALRVLDNDSDGFFLMVEGGEIDKAAHVHETLNMVGEVKELSRTVDEVMSWAASHPDTLVMVLADHETGGLTVQYGRGAGLAPQVTWSTSGHTGANVPVYMTGLGCQVLPPVIDNTQVPAILSGKPFP